MINSEQFFSLDRPLHALPGRRQVKAANLNGLPQLVSRLGGDIRDVLDPHGMTSQVITNPENFLDCQTVVDLLEDCARRFNDPLFGIHFAQLQEPDLYGSVTALCRSAPNLREAIKCLVSFIPVVHCSESVLELVEGRETAEIPLVGAFGHGRQ